MRPPEKRVGMSEKWETAAYPYKWTEEELVREFPGLRDKVANVQKWRRRRKVWYWRFVYRFLTCL